MFDWNFLLRPGLTSTNEFQRIQMHVGLIVVILASFFFER